MKNLFKLVVAMMISVPAYAQEVEMADTMRSEGKIYVVVAILLVILAGLILYVVTIDRKASRLEKKLEEFTKRQA